MPLKWLKIAFRDRRQARRPDKWKASLALLLLILLPATSVLAQSAVAPVRLALIADDATAATAADLLTVELTGVPSLQLLERTEIARIRREQGLSIVNGNYVKLGQMLGADGLLILEPSKEGTNQFLSARLVAVKPGVIIGSLRTPWPVPDVAQWAKWIPARFGPLFPKLGVLAKDAVPISVVNLRAAVKSPQSEETEQQLTALAIERLTQQRELFVLERRRMELLSDEKELKGQDNSAFWDGSYLLDGTIDRDGYSQDTVTLNARLTPPKGGAPVTIAIKGSRTNLNELVNQLAARITQEMKLNARATEWNPAEEADQYFEEARWAFKWKMLKEAQFACESGWALGKQTEEAAAFRIGIYQAEGAPTYFNWLSLKPTDPGPEPDLSNIAPALRALQLYQQGFQNYMANSPKPDAAWHNLGLSLLGMASELLARCQYYPDVWKAQEDDVAAIRRCAQETLAMIYNHPAYRDSYFEKAGIQLEEGGAWQDTPDQYFAICREIARSNILCQLLPQADARSRVGWTSGERIRANELRRQFIQELCASTNGLNKVAGYYLASTGKTPDSEYRQRMFQLFDVAIENGHALVAAGLQDTVLNEIEWKIKGPTYGSFASDIQREVYERFRYDVPFEVACNALVEFLETDNDFKVDDYEKFADPMKSGGSGTFLVSQTRVKRVLAAMDAYRARIVQRQKEHKFVYNFWQFFDSNERWLRRAFPAETPAIGATIISPVPRTSATVRPNTNKPSESTMQSVVHVTRFWSMPPTSTFDYGNMASGLQITAGKFSEGRYWIEVFNGDSQYEPRAAFIYAINLTNFQTETIRVPRESHEGAPWFGKSFEVMSNFVYLSGLDKIRRYSLTTKTWEDLPVPVNGPQQLNAVGDRLFLVSQDSLQELKANGRELELVASTRRRPAANILDTLPDYRDNPLILSESNRMIRILLRGEFYSQGADGWTKATFLPNGAVFPTVRVFGDNLTLRVSGAEREERLYVLYHNQPFPVLAMVLPRPRETFERAETDIPEPLLPDHPGKPLWQRPRGIATDQFYTILDGEKLWLFSSDVSVRAAGKAGALLVEQEGHHAILAELKKDAALPRLIPLWLDQKQGMLSAEWWEAFRHYNPADSVTLQLALIQPTPAGIVVGYNNVPGFWLIGRDELEERSTNQDPNGSLLAAAEANDLNAVEDALTKGASVDARNYRGWTPLMIAAKAGNFDLGKLLIEKGADVEAKSTASVGSTVLDFAADGNNPDLIKALINHGAPVNAPGEDGLTPLYHAAVNQRRAAAETLLALGANVERFGPEDDRGRRYTPLMGAAINGDTNMMMLLLSKGAKIEKTTTTGDTALMVTSKTGHAESVRLLISRGADVNAASPNGETALIYAAYNGQFENIRLLLAAGANPLATAASDNDGIRRYDAAIAAREREHPEAMALILQAQEKARAAK